MQQDEITELTREIATLRTRLAQVELGNQNANGIIGQQADEIATLTAQLTAAQSATCPLCKAHPKAQLCEACVYDTECAEGQMKLEARLARVTGALEAERQRHVDDSYGSCVRCIKPNTDDEHEAWPCPTIRGLTTALETP